MRTLAAAAPALALLSGCGAIALGDPTNSGFAVPSATGQLSEVQSSTAVGGSDFSSLTGNGYGYQVGSVSNDGLQGFAGLVPGASVAPATTPGLVTMEGDFELAYIGFILAVDTEVSGSAVTDQGRLTMNVDFSDGSVTGSGTGIDSFSNFLLNGNALEIDGTLTGNQLNGTATYNGVTGPMQGLIGSNEGIGVFQGHTDGQVHAGGFIVN
ncbi:hypothetical protein LOM8899_02061 [Flavimaricola marinus]|uniref:Transferrin-binding protein B C-lobe/N-lobe beta barrel domain-containing protein n=2 Tax=Flavimaricola marinus TaxID=1819565 RepID=A0A238LG25_9RHOB|nr:hypothetical protein LOM8899_02061 [Flavimaricola marinus]